MRRLYTSASASELLDVHPNTLRAWANDGKIAVKRMPNGDRRYDLHGFLHGKPVTIAYARVSSHKQKDDLERQKARLLRDYPEAEVVSDVASGLNWRRKGLKAILERAMRGTPIKLVVSHRDRLARFGFELVAFIVEGNGGEVVVLDGIMGSPESELASDIASIVHVFSCRIHGRRAAANRAARNAIKALSDPGAEADARAAVRG